MEWDKKAVSNTLKPPRKAVEAGSVIRQTISFLQVAWILVSIPAREYGEVSSTLYAS